MQLRSVVLVGLMAGTLNMAVANASERYFTYVYEPETMPQGATEFEQTITLRTQRSDDVGQRNFNQWELREEFEYGVTDNYTAALYINTEAVSFRDPTTGASESEFSFDGISLENRYMVLNPAEHAVGLTLYLEPRYSGGEAEVEQKIILGQRFGDWKWAFNVTHATEWRLNEHETEGEFEVTTGITRHFNKRWSAGIEFRNHNELPEYREWENTAFFLGPVVTYTRENWWATLTVLPQVWGRFTGSGSDPDGVGGLELEGHERVNVRLIFGFSL
jgi:hypothetical protein